MMSYAKKYGLLNALLLPTGEDSDQPQSETLYPPKGATKQEVKQETKSAKATILADITKARHELGITPENVAAIGRSVLQKDPKDADPGELQLLLDNLRNRLTAQNAMKGTNNG
jgi:hypothetical protein